MTFGTDGTSLSSASYVDRLSTRRYQLPAFAAERRRLQHGTHSAPDISCLPTGRSVANPTTAVAAVDR